MMLEWKHTENGETNFIQLPVKIIKSVNNDYGFGGKLICNKCSSQLFQKYRCDKCSSEYTVGEIENRKDNITGIIYNDKDKKEFMEFKIDENIKVEREINNMDLIDNIEFIDSFYEIYNNDDEKSSQVIRKIHNFLNKKNIIFLVNFGYRGKDMGGFIISAKNKLLLAELRDYKLIKDTKQLSILTRKSEIETELNAITESQTPQMYKEFLLTVADGKKLVKPKPKEEKIAVEVGFLDGF